MRALAVAAQEGRFETEGWRVRKDGTRFWANVVIDAIRDDRGALAGYAKITRDMTERRIVEEQLRQSQKMEAIGQLTVGWLTTSIISSLRSFRTWNWPSAASAIKKRATIWPTR